MYELERLRRESDLSQADLAKASGVGISSIVKLENGRDVTAKTARRLASFFNRPWPIFFADVCCNYSITARPDADPAA